MGVNRVNFKICDTRAYNVVLQDFVYEHGPNMLLRHLGSAYNRGPKFGN